MAVAPEQSYLSRRIGKRYQQQLSAIQRALFTDASDMQKWLRSRPITPSPASCRAARFAEEVRGGGRFTFANDTIHLPFDLIETAALNPQHRPFRGLILHELGHRDDGPHSSFKSTHLAILILILVLVIAAFWLYFTHQWLWWGAAAAVIPLCVAGQVQSRRKTEYYCDDYARLHSDSDTILATLTALLTGHNVYLAEKPRWAPAVDHRASSAHPPTVRTTH